MDYEKEYKEAISRAKIEQETFLNLGNISAKTAIERIFPELCESEDEKIRRELIDIVKKSPITFAFDDKDKVLVWLEKQGSQKSIEKVEPKFKVGDWIVKQYLSSPFVIVDIKNDSYILNDIEGNKYEETIDFAHKVYHIWTIKDAEDGDVLTYRLDNGKVLIIIYEDLGESYNGQVNIHGILDGDDSFDESAVCVCCKFMELLTPATKEQRELLFQKMKEAGYEWDAEKKELKKIEQKSAWTEEDEKMLLSIINDAEQGALLDKEQIDWLKSLKPQSYWKPSEEQMIALRWVLNNIPYNKHKEVITQMVEQLKNL